MIWWTFYVDCTHDGKLFSLLLACVAGGIVGARDKLKSGEAAGRMGRNAVSVFE